LHGEVNIYKACSLHHVILLSQINAIIKLRGVNYKLYKNNKIFTEMKILWVYLQKTVAIAKYKNIQYQNKPEDKIKLARSA
jgi:hypothetical protein